MTIEIRPARPEDPAWIAEMHAVHYPPEFGFDDGFGKSIAEKIGTFRAKNDPAKQIWIAEDGGERLGSIALSTHESGNGFLNFVLVLPGARGRGVARALMDHAIAAAQQGGFRILILETYSCLVAARTLYRNYGFEVTEVTKGLQQFGQTFDREFWQKTL